MRTNHHDPAYIARLIEAGCYLTTEQAAIYLGLSPRTLEYYRWKGIGPEYKRFRRNGQIRYSATVLKTYAELENAT